MTDRALNYLGLMRKAGRIEIGETATGASPNARRRVESFLQGRRALCATLPYTKEQLSDALGKSGCSMAACTDFGLSDAFMKALAETDPQTYGTLAAEMTRRSDKAAYRKARGPKRKPGRELNE